MKEAWKQFLVKEAGANSSDGHIIHYGNFERELRIATAGNTLLDLSHLGLIAVHGEDAIDYMQNLFCNDVRDIDDNHSQLNAMCSAKGRVIANFRLFKRKEIFYLQLPVEMMEAITKRLKMFVLRAKVEINDASENFIRIGCTGPGIEKELSSIIGNIPSEPNQVLHQGDLTIIRTNGHFPRFELLGDLTVIKNIWEKLNVQAAAVGSYQWKLHNILAGIPTIYPETSEAFVPQAANFREIGSLSFTKGCYPGQEVVARTQYLGKIKRRMYLAHIESDVAAQPGDEIIDRDRTVVGKVVDCQSSPDDGCDLLAILQIEAAEKTQLTLNTEEMTPLKICKLPYEWADD
jgi:hypothetical protein